MKLLILSVLFCSQAFSQDTGRSGIYDLNIQTFAGDSINMATLQGHKILIVSATANNLQPADMNFWDSVQASNSPLAVILIPANDMGNIVNDDSAVNAISTNVPGNIILAAGALVKKQEAQDQNPILQWLTQSNENTHFNTDVVTDEQIYVVSESGVLYAVLEKGVPAQVIDHVLKQPDVTQ